MHLRLAALLGLDVVARIGKLGDPATEQPTATVVVESVEIRRGG